VNTVSDKVVQHSLANLIVQKWLVVGDPFYRKFWLRLIHPLQKHLFPIDIRS